MINTGSSCDSRDPLGKYVYTTLQKFDLLEIILAFYKISSPGESIQPQQL